MEETRYDETSLAQDSYYEDEGIDTLSLSDLQIYDNNGDPQDFYRPDDQKFSFDDEDKFEFSSELPKTSVNNNIVFCGKIISYKQPSVYQNTQKLERKKQHKHHKRRWWLVRFFKKSSTSKSNIDSDKLDLKYEVPIRRVSILASSTKPRWYFLMFGFGSSNFPAQMHIRDLKKRQTSIGTKDSMDNKISTCNGGGIGSWRLIKFLGCNGGGGGDDNHHLNAIMKIY